MELDFPDQARDLGADLDSVLAQRELKERQAWGTALASALASRNPLRLEAVEREEPAHLNSAALPAAMMAMSNVFYRFPHLTSNKRYASMPSRLRVPPAHRTEATMQISNSGRWRCRPSTTARRA